MQKLLADVGSLNYIDFIVPGIHCGLAYVSKYYNFIACCTMWTNLGVSGAGKTTMFKILTDLLPPTMGEVHGDVTDFLNSNLVQGLLLLLVGNPCKCAMKKWAGRAKIDGQGKKVS